MIEDKIIIGRQELDTLNNCLLSDGVKLGFLAQVRISMIGNETILGGR